MMEALQVKVSIVDCNEFEDLIRALEEDFDLLPDGVKAAIMALIPKEEGIDHEK